MKFDPDSEYQKHRDVNGGVWFIQNGHRFTLGHKDLGPVGSTEKPPKEDKKLKDVRKRAAKKLKDFAGSDESAGPVADALKENRSAEAAEANA
jgi:hypothetical protein